MKVRDRLRIMAVIPSYFGSSGDAVNERQLISWINRSLGGGVSVITFQKDAKRRLIEYDPSLRLFVFPLSLSLLPIQLLVSFMLVPLLCLLRLAGYFNVIYIREGSSLALGPSMFKMLIGVPVVVKFAGFRSTEMKFRKPRLMPRAITKKILEIVDTCVIHRADLLFVLSSLFRDDLVQWYGLSAGKVKVLSAGVDVGYFSSIKRQQTRGKAYRVGYIGSIAYMQGVDVLVRAMQLVQVEMPNAVLVIVGGGPELGGIRKMVHELNVKAIITGRVPHNQISTYLRTFDVFVISRRVIHSTQRVVPIKLLEACAAGVPSIITKSEVVEANFRDGKDLLTVQPEDPNDLTVSILTLLKDPSLRETLSSNARKVAGRFDWNMLAKNTIAELIRLVKKRVARAPAEKRLDEPL